jgi:selenium metabolism protein YedF
MNGGLTMRSKVLLVTADVIGRGEDELGELLMSTFLRQLGDSQEKPSTLLFLNTGVRLVCRGSNVLAPIKDLEGQGVEILSCSTCLEYFNLREQLVVGNPTTMANTIQLMMTSDVIGL